MGYGCYKWSSNGDMSRINQRATKVWGSSHARSPKACGVATGPPQRGREKAPPCPTYRWPTWTPSVPESCGPSRENPCTAIPSRSLRRIHGVPVEVRVNAGVAAPRLPRFCADSLRRFVSVSTVCRLCRGSRPILPVTSIRYRAMLMRSDVGQRQLRVIPFLMPC